MRVADEAWERLPGTGWLGTSLAAVENRDLDVPIVDEALTPANRSVAEDHGTSYIEGARARHCRITVDGDTLRRAVPEVELLIGDADISRWRVDLDYWVFADGAARPGRRPRDGPAGALLVDALSAVVRFRLTAVDRGLPVTVLPTRAVTPTGGSPHDRPLGRRRPADTARDADDRGRWRPQRAARRQARPPRPPARRAGGAPGERATPGSGRPRSRGARGCRSGPSTATCAPSRAS